MSYSKEELVSMPLQRLRQLERDFDTAFREREQALRDEAERQAIIAKLTSGWPDPRGKETPYDAR